MEQIILRTASLADLETLLQFEQGVISAERPFDPTLKPGNINYYDLKEMLEDPEVEIMVAQSGNEIIGSGYARIENSKPYLKHRKHAYFGFMYVRPDYRGKGVNQKIIKALQQWSAAKGISEIRLDVYHGNAPAIKAYEKAGFSRHMIEMRMNLEGYQDF